MTYPAPPPGPAPRQRYRWWPSAGCLLAVAAAVLPIRAEARSAPVVPVASAPAAPADTVGLLAVRERPWSPAVAVTLSFPAGHGGDPPGGEGTAWLLGMVLLRAARAGLADTGASLDIRVEGSSTVVTALTSRGRWGEVYRILMRTLVDDPVDATLTEGIRGDLSARLFFQRGAPVRSFELEAERLLLGAEHPLARAPMGTPSSVGSVTLAALELARAHTFTRAGARIAVTGPVTPAEAAEIVGTHRTRVFFTEGSWTVEGVPPSTGTQGPAWESGACTTVVDEITNSWIVAAYPLPPAASHTLYQFAAHVIGRELLADPVPAGLIAHRVELRDLPSGPVLVVTAAVSYLAARDWERHIGDVVRKLAAAPLGLGVADRRRRSFRSEAARAVASSEEEGRQLLADIERTGRPRVWAEELALLSPEALQDAVAVLGGARMLVYGPEGSASGEGSAACGSS